MPLLASSSYRSLVRLSIFRRVRKEGFCPAVGRYRLIIINTDIHHLFPAQSAAGDLQALIRKDETRLRSRIHSKTCSLSLISTTLNINHSTSIKLKKHRSICLCHITCLNSNVYSQIRNAPSASTLSHHYAFLKTFNIDRNLKNTHCALLFFVM